MINILISLFISAQVFAQTAPVKNKTPYPAKYTSAEDSAATIKSLTVAPAYDNVGGIYKNAAEAELKHLISQDQMWSYSDFKPAQKDFRIDTFEENPELTLSTLTTSNADALFTVLITKGAQGLTVTLNLFTKDRGLLLLQESTQDATAFELQKLKDILQTLYTNIKNKLPYKALIMSRRGNQVTLNIGSKSGVKTGDKLAVAQILKINRHPKRKFMTGVEKEIIGQITIIKADEFLSFAEISFEKETGVIEKGSKILSPTYVQYASDQGSNMEGILPNEKNPIEWLPAPVPQFGKISVLGGFTNYKLSTVLQDSTNYSSENHFAPTIELNAELWVTKDFFASLGLNQMFFKGNNDLAGSSPGSLNYNISTYEFLGGYKYLITDNFWGPNLTLGFGYGSQRTRVTDSSQVAFTSTELSGWQFDIGGYFPVTEKNDVGIGVNARFMFSKSFSESPVESGGADPTHSQFSIYGIYQYTTNLHLKGKLNYSATSTSFSGQGSRTNPARSLDETMTSYLFGIEYLF